MTDISKEAGERVAYIVEAIPQPWRGAILQQQDKIEAQAARIEELEGRQYKLAYAIAGGEDAHGLLDSVPTSELVEMIRKERETARDAEAYAIRSARNDALKEAADVCKYNSSEWDSTAKRHNLKKWSLNIGCAHVGHAYEAAILAIMTKEPNT